MAETDPAPAAALVQARAQFADLGARVHARGLALRQPPPEPTTCCGRGCNGCVWAGFYDAAAAWVDDAQAALQAASKPCAGTPAPDLLG